MLFIRMSIFQNLLKSIIYYILGYGKVYHNLLHGYIGMILNILIAPCPRAPHQNIDTKLMSIVCASFVLLFPSLYLIRFWDIGLSRYWGGGGGDMHSTSTLESWHQNNVIRLRTFVHFVQSFVYNPFPRYQTFTLEGWWYAHLPNSEFDTKIMPFVCVSFVDYVLICDFCPVVCVQIP